MSTATKFRSQKCIAGMRRGDAHAMVESIFGESFLSIDIAPTENIYILRLAIYNDNDIVKIKNFVSGLKARNKHKFYSIVTYKPIDFSLLMGKKGK